MAKRNRTPAASGRARSAPVQVKKPFPWGTVLVSVVLAALLIGIVVYAFMNQGSGVRDLLAEDDESFDGLITLGEPSRDHVDGTVDYENYPERPPAGGEHSSVPQQCQVYEEEIAPEHAVHSLEHGAVWVTYSPDLPDDQVQILVDEVEGDPHRLLSPLEGQQAPVVVTAWGRQLELESAEDGDLERFLDVYTNGRQTPERGAPCAGTTSTGRGDLGTTPGAEASIPAADDPAEQPPAPTPTATTSPSG
ncbi:MAG TPA: DUF3105 domain-containing protein [Mycobacteriales bacterium]|nr:DUF3105 domain-containing protein [Mycobacteriales bacterium]